MAKKKAKKTTKKKTRKKKVVRQSKAAQELTDMGKDIEVPSNEGGRPTEYKEQYNQMLIDHMAKGLSFDCFGATIGIHRATLYRWVKEIKGFCDAYEEGKDKNLYFWEMLGVSGSSGLKPGFNSSAYNFQMKNRHKWTDKIEHSGQIKDGGLGSRVDQVMADPKMKAAARALAEGLAGVEDEE